jgi:rubredoxin
MSYVCRQPGCGRTFDTKHGRAAHERLFHGESYRETEPDHVCPHCGAGFENELRYQAHLRDAHGIPSKTLDWVETRTFENLVYLYNDELQKITSDQVVAGTLSEREKTRLLREGVLVIEEHGRMGKKTVYRLTEEALEALRQMDQA